MPEQREVFTAKTPAKAPLFTFVFDTCTTFGEKCQLLLGGISIRGTVLTFYNAMTQPITDQEYPDFSTGRILSHIPNRDFTHSLIKYKLAHDIQHLHPSETPAQLRQHLAHSHLDIGSVFTPEKLKECLDYIAQQQEDIPTRKKFLDPNTNNNKMLAFEFIALLQIHGADNLPVLDAETPLIDKTQIPEIIQKYTRYYDTYKTAMEEDLHTFKDALKQHHQEKLEQIAKERQEKIDQFFTSTEDVVRTAASSAIDGALSSALMNTLRKSLNTRVDNESTEWILHTLNIALSLYLGSTVYPAIFATVALSMSKLVGMSNTHSRLASNAVSLATNVAMHHHELTALKTGVSLVSGFVGGLFGHQLVESATHYISPKVKTR